MVVACIALTAALAPASYATVKQLIPRNSVGTAQLRTNSVTSDWMVQPTRFAVQAPNA